MNAIELFKDSVDPHRTTLRRLPKQILVFGGGPIGIEDQLRNSSLRNAFLNWCSESSVPLKDHFLLPEYFSEWNRFSGYQNLVDFEREAAAISCAILLFCESPGSLAELGAFCMDKILSERLLVVISKGHHAEDSFVVHGPITKLKGEHSDESVCVIEASTPADFYQEAWAVYEALRDKVGDAPRKTLLDINHIRDQLLLMADMIELFGATTEVELIGLMDFFGVKMERATFRRLAGQLKLFNLIANAHMYNNNYWIAPAKDRDSYMDYVAAKPGTRFDRTRFKMNAFEQLKKHVGRRKAYESIHGDVRHGSS